MTSPTPTKLADTKPFERISVDLPIDVPPYPRVMVHSRPGGRGYVSNPKALEVLHAFYEHVWFLLPPIVRGKEVTGDLHVAIAIWKPTKRGDLDNCVKSILDAFTKARVWKDDRQVISLSARFMARNAEPRFTVVICAQGAAHV